MLKEFLKEVVVLVVGKQAEEIADLLNSKKHVNEFLIAKKLDITINQTRNILYKLSDHGLVSSVRKKDKKKGWYTYFWRIEILKALEFLRGHYEKRKDQIGRQIESREAKQFYFCQRCGIEFNEENALLQNFTCHECGDVFGVKDNTKLLKELGKVLAKIEKRMENILGEIGKEEKSLEKERERILKKEAKIKEKEKAKRKALRDKLKKKELKKSEKKNKKSGESKMKNKKFEKNKKKIKNKNKKFEKKNKKNKKVSGKKILKKKIGKNKNKKVKKKK